MPHFRIERRQLKESRWPVAGVDEAGRGPLAGPVAVAGRVGFFEVKRDDGGALRGGEAERVTSGMVIERWRRAQARPIRFSSHGICCRGWHGSIPARGCRLRR